MIKRMSRRVGVALATTAAVLAPITVFTAQPAHALQGPVTTTIGTAQLEAVFSAPTADGNGDQRLLDQYIRLIDGTPAGESIRAGIYSIAANKVYDAFVRAKNRGVKIYVVHSGHDKAADDETPLKLASLLGSNHRWCDHGATDGSQGEACISNSNTGLQHAKYALFSKTKNASGTLKSHVTWFGSANLTYATGAKTFNNTITVYGDQATYDGFYNGYWLPQWEERTYANNDFYRSGMCGPVECGFFGSTNANVHVYGSPEQELDLVEGRLGYVDPDADCRIRVMQASINDTRMAVVNKLVELKHAGCKVWVVVDGIGQQALATLKGAGIPVRQHEVHDKMFLTNSRYAGSAHLRPIVFTGSHNLSLSALRHNDELFVKVNDSPALYDAYFNHFNDAYNYGTVL